MVKTLEFKDYFDFAAPELVFKLLYEDDSFTKFYHKEVNKDANASATTWIEKDGGRHRVVTFKPHISNVPFFLQGLIGSDIGPLMELQQYKKVGSTITIHSELSAALFWGFTLVSKGDTVLSPLEKGCEIVVKLTIEVQTTWWNVQDKVEKDAEKEAESAFKRWLNKARVFCEGKMGIEVQPSLEREESFYDAVELEEEEAFTPVELTTEFRYGPLHSGRLQFLHVAWKILWNQIERDVSLFKHATFSVKAWTTLGLGIAAGLTLGLLYSRHLQKNK